MLGFSAIADAPLSSSPEVTPSLSIPITTATYLATFNTISFKQDRVLSVTAGGYNLTLNSLTFGGSRAISLATRAYNLTLNPLTLSRSGQLVIGLDRKVLSLGLNDISFTKVNKLTLETSPHSFTEFPVNFTWVHSTPLDSRSYVLTTNNINLSLGSGILPKTFSKNNVVVIITYSPNILLI